MPESYERRLTMLIIFNSLKNFLLTITHNANYINLFGTVIAAFISYKAARYTASRPNKIKVKQLQLSNVYLPLFRMFESVPDDLTLQKAVYLHKKITNILDKNYELAFPQLHQLNKSFGSSVLAGSGYQIYFHRMKHIVATDYELLKKSLGYPSENFFNIFVRMTFKQKMRSLISWINMIWIFAPIILAFFSSNSKSAFHNTGSIIFFSMVTFFPLIKINKWINDLKD